MWYYWSGPSRAKSADSSDEDDNVNVVDDEDVEEPDDDDDEENTTRQRRRTQNLDIPGKISRIKYLILDMCLYFELGIIHYQLNSIVRIKNSRILKIFGIHKI